MKKKLTFEDLEMDFMQDNLKAAEELWEMAAELPQEVEKIELPKKEFKIPDDELAYEIYQQLPSSFTFKGKQWNKAEFTHFCQKKKVDLNDLQTMQMIDAEIKENMQAMAMEVDDDLFNDLLSLKSSQPGPTPSLEGNPIPNANEKVEQNEVQIIKEEKFNTVDEALESTTQSLYQNIMDEIQSLKERVSALEDENRLLKEINKSLSQNKEEQKKDTKEISQLTIPSAQIINGWINEKKNEKEETTPKRRRGRPAGYKTSDATKEKQRKARLKAIQNKSNEIPQMLSVKSKHKNHENIPTKIKDQTEIYSNDHSKNSC